MRGRSLLNLGRVICENPTVPHLPIEEAWAPPPPPPQPKRRRPGFAPYSYSVLQVPTRTISQHGVDQIKTNKKPTSQKNAKKKQKDQEIQNTMSWCVCACWPTIPVHRACPGEWLTYPLRRHRRKLIFPLLVSINS